MLDWIQENLFHRGKQTMMLRQTAMFALCWLLLYGLAGLILGWSAVHQGDGVALTFARAAVLAALWELVRTLLVWALPQLGWNRTATWCTTALLLAVAQVLPASSLAGLQTPLALCQTLVGNWLPALVQSALLTELVLEGGLLPGLVYRLALMLPTLFSWEPAISTGVQLGLYLVLPAIFLLLAGENQPEPEAERAEKPSCRPLGWIPFAAALGLVLCFFVGLLPWRPAAIATGSMEPNIHVGDVVVISCLDKQDLEVGDVIAFQKDGQTVVHRVVETIGQGEDVAYVTQGDANNGPDSGQVTGAELEGKVVARLPGVGWLSLWLHGGA